MKILMVLTSHDQMGDTGHKTGFWLEEFTAPYYVFRDAGAEITIASPKGGQPPADPNSEGEDALRARARLFVDSRETTLGHIGELMIPIAAGVITPESVRGDLYDLVSGAPGRQSADEITLFKNGGGAHLDLMMARYIVARAG